MRHPDGYAISVSNGDKKSITYERPDYTGPDALLSAAIGFVLFVVCFPFLAIFLPIAIPVMVVLYLMSDRAIKKARSAADKRMLGNISKLDLEVSELVLNDWGVFLGAAGKPGMEISWQEITLVDEPQIAMLVFHTHTKRELRIDLSQDRYFEVIWAIHSKIPDRTDFQVDPVTSESRILAKIRKQPLELRGKYGHLIVSDEYISRNGIAIPWKEITAAEERSFSGEDVNISWSVTVRSDRSSFTLKSLDFCDGPQVWDTDYDLIKTIISLKLPNKVSFDRRLPTPQERAIEEYNRCQEAIKVGFTLALKSGKFTVPEKYFRHMHALVERFHLEGKVDTRTLYQDYAELLDRTNRPEEAAKMHERVRTAAFHASNDCF
jgi:hypothetical protein